MFIVTFFMLSKDAAKTLAQSKEEGRQAGESVQRLEEELEVADARWKAAQEQLAAADRREKRYSRHCLYTQAGFCGTAATAVFCLILAYSMASGTATVVAVAQADALCYSRVRARCNKISYNMI